MTPHDPITHTNGHLLRVSRHDLTHLLQLIARNLTQCSEPNTANAARTIERHIQATHPQEPVDALVQT